MSESPKPVILERAKTDASLETERKRLDEQLTDQQRAHEEADAVVETARARADAVLEAAREVADDKQESDAAPAVERERAVADQVVQDERCREDERLAAERRRLSRIWADQLPDERDETDRRLLTERRRADLELTNRDDFLSIVSHDLRNLLAGIVLSAELLESEHESAAAESRRSASQRIGRYASRMTRLIGDLQDVGSIDAGRFSVSATSADLLPLVEEAGEAFAPAARAKQIDLQLGLESAPVVALLDAGRIIQVISNLLSNAIKFTPAGGRITVHCDVDGKVARCTVSDSGSGIPADQLDRIFDRFWQVRAGDRRGLGLGLYISRCLIEAHKGKLWAQSTLGQGSRLTFTVPAA